MSATYLVFDMDGVLAEVTESYRESVVQTVLHFTGKTIERDSIQEYKNRGGFNNDWLLSQQICADLGVQVPYAVVAKYFCDLFLNVATSFSRYSLMSSYLILFEKRCLISAVPRTVSNLLREAAPAIENRFFPGYNSLWTCMKRNCRLMRLRCEASVM